MTAMNYKELAEKLVNRGLRRGADEIEVYVQTSRSLSIRVRQEDIETIRESDTGGVGFRVLVDNSMGFSHCNDFSDRSLDETLERRLLLPN